VTTALIVLGTIAGCAGLIAFGFVMGRVFERLETVRQASSVYDAIANTLETTNGD
jgi:hypothetical protein